MKSQAFIVIKQGKNISSIPLSKMQICRNFDYTEITGRIGIKQTKWHNAERINIVNSFSEFDNKYPELLIAVLDKHTNIKMTKTLKKELGL